MGRQIALQCALRGFPVALNDSRQSALDEAGAFYRDYLEGRIAKGKLDAAGRDAALARVRTSADLEDAASGANVVIEAIVEQFEPKAESFRRLDVLRPPEALLTSNSSSNIPRLTVGRSHPAPRPGAEPAFLQPGAGDGARRSRRSSGCR